MSSFIEYRDEICSLRAGPGRTVKQEQEEILPNHVQRINLISVSTLPSAYMGFEYMVFRQYGHGQFFSLGPN